MSSASKAKPNVQSNAQPNPSKVQRYLGSLRWDGVPRIGSALGDGNAEASEIFFGSAAGRALWPGSAVDRSLVLVDPDDAVGYRWLRALGGADFGLVGTWVLESSSFVHDTADDAAQWVVQSRQGSASTWGRTAARPRAGRRDE